MKKLLGLSLGLFSTFTFASSYVVEMNHKLSAQEIQQIKARGVKNIERFTPYSSEYFDRLYSIEYKGDKKDLLAIPNVKLVEKEFEADFFEIKANPQSELTTNDLLFPLQWGLQNQGQLIIKQKLKGGPETTQGKLGVDIGWKESIKSIEQNLKKTPVVAVVDMGIDFDHPDLKDQIAKNMAECDENGNVPAGERTDRDGNGYIADCHGFNFAVLRPERRRGQPPGVITDWQYPIDYKNHGTHVSGIIAAKANNQIGVSGVSDKIKILPVKVTGRVDETSSRERLVERAPSKRIANGILYAVRRGVDVINLSLGWPTSMDTNYMRNVIAEAVKNNIVVVAAAGNNNTNGNIFPCAYQNVICVGSVDADGSVSKFSNYGGEVDILAPGDQILSTIPDEFIPLKMNIQGYDILSGTSQAAPFVSAAAALLKGTYEDIKLTDIMRRLFDSAGKKSERDAFKSQHGLMNLKRAFEIKNAPSIKPIFKTNSELVFRPQDGKFNLILPIRNYGAPVKNVKVDVFFKDRRVKLDSNSISFPVLKNYNSVLQDMANQELEEGQRRVDMSAVKFTGKVTSKFIDKQTRFKVIISILNDEGQPVFRRDYEHEVTVSKQFLIPNRPGPNKINFKFNNPERPVPVGIWDREKNKLRDNLRTVIDSTKRTDYPGYYVKFEAKAAQGETLPDDQDGIKLFFFNYENGAYVEAANTYFSHKAKEILSVNRHDYNYDGKLDILIKTYVKPDLRDNTTWYILYSYRNLDMSPLVGEFSDIRYYPRIVSVTPSTVRLMKTKLANDQYLALPYFISRGRLPDEDQIYNPWKPKDTSVLRRIYRLEAVDGENGTKVFKARTDMNSQFMDVVRRKLKDSLNQTISLEDTNVQIIQLINQTEEDYDNGLVKALASVGLGYFRENALITFNGADFEIEVQDKVTERLEASAHHPVFDLTDNNLDRVTSNAFVSFLTDDLVNITSVLGNSEIPFSYRMIDQNDRILSFLAIFQNANQQTSVLETVDYVMMVESENGEQKQLKRKVKKFSFLPGSRMSELYIPLAIANSRGGMQPAIYVDATSLAGNNIYLLTKIGNNLIAPIDMSLNIPNYCVAKNPLRTLKGNAKYALLCRTNEGYSMNYVDLVAP